MHLQISVQMVMQIRSQMLALNSTRCNFQKLDITDVSQLMESIICASRANKTDEAVMEK